MSGVYLVQHKNGKTKVFIVDQWEAYLCRDGHVVHRSRGIRGSFGIGRDLVVDRKNDRPAIHLQL
jgi:hypothetical protein